ncbi:hypothetical protein F2P81_011394 [Scophthalmus maximus]|uniref:Secreted protein n=1 Tax=Scophthalmus maximus TaxID=52904 RepID=A0A6A4T1G3_SCOMX|nr:hypothetical protein F2P81_011394 [Scophthalmus maximus]
MMWRMRSSPVIIPLRLFAPFASSCIEYKRNNNRRRRCRTRGCDAADLPPLLRNRRESPQNAAAKGTLRHTPNYYAV